ncbi:MBL fold metallo-hydrolase [Patescibacteria group bacterium]|nr:MBL fold metallo-hydrolase [Patescibacteria group bacterium]MBU1028590.1 MBL fold metallo-hydrolase [Patescibacteria group bacterium]MBU1915752.1 MBL fold metallo-hydrolase [Patescibacteria group bacterium]
MNITWFGYSCFKLEFGSRANDKVSLVTDPFAKEGRNGLPRTLSAEIVTVSHDHERHNNISDVGGNPFVISGPGEYEIKDVAVSGVQAYHDDQNGQRQGTNTIYYIISEDIHLAHLGDLKHKLDENQLSEVCNIDVLFVPVGGGDVLSGKEAAEVVSQFEPRIIIPMHYKSGRWGSRLDGVEPFLKAMGVSSPEIVNKLKITPRDLPQEEAKVILIESQ